MTEIRPLFTWRAAICDSDLGPTTRHVALTLALYMNERGGSAHPGPTRLAHDTGLSLRAVKAHLAELVQTGWLAVVEQGGLKGERRHANVYEARVPAPTLPVDINPIHPEPVHDVHPCTTFTRVSDDAYPCTSRQLPVHQVHPITSRTLQELTKGERTRARANNRSTIPNDWTPPQHLVEQLAGQGWSRTTQQAELGKFRAYQRDRGRESHDWAAAYDLWIRRTPADHVPRTATFRCRTCDRLEADCACGYDAEFIIDLEETR